MRVIKVPKFQDAAVSKFLDELMRELERSDREKVSAITANHSVLLQSNDSKVYEITVSSAGALVITKVSG
jgi:hypothetical protein